MQVTKSTLTDTKQLRSMCTMAKGDPPSESNQLLLEIISDLTALKKVDSEDYQNCLNLLRSGTKN